MLRTEYGGQLDSRRSGEHINGAAALGIKTGLVGKQPDCDLVSAMLQ